MKNVLDSMRGLIVDSDTGFLRNVGGQMGSTMNPFFASSYAQAESILSNHAAQLGFILLNPSFLPPNGIELIKVSHAKRPNLPVYLIHDQSPCFAPEELKRLAILGSLTKKQVPAFCLSAHEKIHQIAGSFPQSFTPSMAEMLPETSQDGKKYFPVPITNFLLSGPSFFDVYVKVGSKNFVKILSANDTFTVDRIRGYADKGATHFYLSLPSFERCLTYVDMISEAIAYKDTVSVEMKISQFLDRTQKICSQIYSRKTDAEVVDKISEFSMFMKIFLTQIETNHEHVVHLVKDKLHLYQHSVGVLMVMTFLCKHMEIQSDAAFRSVGLAALLHDIGLTQMPEHYHTEDPSKLTPEELEKFKTHPEVGAALLQQVDGVDPIIVEAVRNHHIRRNGSGFPKGSKSASRLAEMIGISDEFVRLLTQKQSQPTLDPLYHMQAAVLDAFSFPVSDAFSKTFLGR